MSNVQQLQDQNHFNPATLKLLGKKATVFQQGRSLDHNFIGTFNQTRNFSV